MSSEKTINLALHKWVPTDPVQREEFNENFGKVDEKFGDVTAQLADNLSLDKSLDGGTVDKDNYAKLVSVISNAKANKKGLYIPNGKYYCSQDLTIEGIRNIRLDGEIIMASGKTLTVNYDSSTVDACDWIINSVKGKLRVGGLKNAKVTVLSATELEVYAHGDNVKIKSTAYSQFWLGNIGIFKMFSEGSTIGWINENVFYGGRIENFIMDGNYTHNNNTFQKPMFENCTINVIRGASNQFYNCRFEGTNTITFGATTFDNFISRSWNSAAGSYLRQTSGVVYTDNGQHNYASNIADQIHSIKSIYEINKQSNNFNPTFIKKNIGNLETLSLNQRVFETDFVKIDEDLGINIKGDTELWKLTIELYDENKVQILTEPSNFMSSPEMSWSTSSNVYITSVSRSLIRCGLFKNTTVKYIKFRVVIGSIGIFSNLDIKVIQLKGKETQIPVLAKHKRHFSTTYPTTGTWEQGDVVYNSNQSAGGYTGWVCVVGGTPGTWNGFGLIELIGSGSPEGIITASIGMYYRDTTNGQLYIKKSGTGNIGWKMVILSA